jgi:hypothetical protein
MLDTRAKHGFRETTTVTDGMAIDWDLPITMEDGVVLENYLMLPIILPK